LCACGTIRRWRSLAAIAAGPTPKPHARARRKRPRSLIAGTCSCAASSGARSPSETGGVLKEAPGSTAYLAAKAKGDKSMPRESGTYLKTFRMRSRKTRAKG
jgi:hypothetical protein